MAANQDPRGRAIGPPRVWMKNFNLPGIAVSRTLGDSVAKEVGVICEPEILQIPLTPFDKFVVLGSDGVFDVFANEEVMAIVVPFWRTGDV